MQLELNQTRGRAVPHLQCAQGAADSPQFWRRIIVIVAALLAAVGSLVGPLTTATASGPAALLVASGVDHTCALLSTGSVSCWGSNSTSQLGIAGGDAASPSGPVAMPGGSAASSIAAGGYHSCAITTGGLVCWGLNSSGQLGVAVGSIGNPTSVSVPGGAVAQVAAGLGHTCVRSTAGAVRCWGSDTYGQLGNGGGSAQTTPPATAISMPGALTATFVAAGSDHACAVLSNGSVACWGRNTNGQVGTGAAGGGVQSPTAITLPAGRTATRLGLGQAHSCALLDDGSVTCWGSDSSGQLGNGSATGNVTSPPTPVALSTTATDVFAGSLHTCVVLSGAGGATCWGDDTVGQLGNGAGGSANAPGASIGGLAASLGAGSAGNGHSCVISSTGDVRCWGDDTVGQLGNAAPLAASQTPSAVLDMPTASPTGSTTTTSTTTTTPSTTPSTASTTTSTASTTPTSTTTTTSTASTSTTTTTATSTTTTAVPIPDGPGAGEFIPLVPARLLDTRDRSGAIGSGVAIDLVVVGRGGVPSTGVEAVAVNLTVVSPAAAGFLTVFPAGSPRPLASAINFVPGDVIANAAVVKLGTGGAMSIYNSTGATHVVVDVVGYFSSGGVRGASLTPVTPERRFDSRDSGVPVGPGATISLQLAGVGSVPADATAVALSVIAVAPTSSSYLTVSPSLVSRPLASSVNMIAGQTIPNLVLAKLGTNGSVDIYNHAGTTHVVVDVVGWFGPIAASSTGRLTGVTPTRVLDTRVGPGPIGRVGAGRTINVAIGGQLGIPADARAVVVNVTTVAPSASGYVAVYPAGVARPGSSTSSFAAGVVLATQSVLKLGANGAVATFNYAGSADYVIDVVGYIS